MHATSESVYLDYSSKDLHFSTIESDPKVINDKNKIGNRYIGISVPDKLLDDFLHEFLRRRKIIDLRKFLGLFPDFDAYIPMLKMGTLEMLMPELAEEHGMETLINIFLNPKEESEETIEILNKFNKVTMKKD
jgi:hypothetical protein